MTDAARLKLFFLSSVDYAGADGSAHSYIAALLALTRSDGSLGENERLLDGDGVYYAESGERADLFAVNAVEAIDRARGASMVQVTSFSGEVRPDVPCDGFTVRRVTNELLYDRHGCFLVISEVEIVVPNPTDLPAVMARIFAGRRTFANIGIAGHMADVFERAANTVVGIVNARTEGDPLSRSDIGFCEENTLPLLLCDTAFEVPLESFHNEERLASIPHPESIGHDYPGAFFHPGWNYTVACGFPFEVCVNLVQMMVRCQAFFFCLSYMKGYFANEFGETVRGDGWVEEADVETAERVRLAFYDLVSRFNRYRNKLFPKYHAEVDRLLDRWRCSDDIGHIKEYIELNFQAKSRLHNARVELQNERQNKALVFIAVLQVIAIYGAFADGLSLYGSSGWLFALSTAGWVAALFAFLLLSRYFRTAAFAAVLLCGGVAFALSGVPGG